MILTEDQLYENFQKLISFISENFKDERKEKLLKMYDELGERIILAPASSFSHFHGCFPGGYALHVLNVIEFSLNVYKLWKHHGSDLNGYTLEELKFCALNHDIGKLGDEKNELYIPNESDWHIRNQGRYYVNNPQLQRMRANERSLYLLQYYGIKMSQNEYIAIQIHDGLFEESNKYYYTSMNFDDLLKVNLPIILHQADYMAYRIEHEQWRKGKNNYNPLKKEKTVKPIDADKLFDSLFKDEEK